MLAIPPVHLTSAPRSPLLQKLLGPAVQSDSMLFLSLKTIAPKNARHFAKTSTAKPASPANHATLVAVLAKRNQTLYRLHGPMSTLSAYQPACTPDFWRGKRVLVTGHTGFKGLAFLLFSISVQTSRVSRQRHHNPQFL